MSESPQTMHGRLLESVHVSGYSFERACSELEWLLEDDRWKRCGEGFAEIRDFLATIDLSPFNIGASNRKRLVKRLAELEASQMTTAKLLGVGVGTVNRDLSAVPNGKGSTKNTQDTKEKKGNGVPNGTTMSGSEAAKAIEDKAARAHVANNSGENEWYTPAEFCDSAHVVMGGIDLDPASCKVANKQVRAKKFWTAGQDSLKREWSGRVWLNPPYGQPLISGFAKKFVDEWQNGRISQAIVLVNNATETAWFQLMATEALVMCFKGGRIKFLDSTGTPANTPLQGQVFLYFGTEPGDFVTEFSKYGVCTA